MCVPVPPSAGSSTKSGPPGTGPSTTQPTAPDYAQYAGMSPYDVQTRAFPGGLPTDWSWDKWMAVNPGAQDPRNHTNTGTAISPQSLAQWNNVGGHIDPASGFTATPGGGVSYTGAPPNPAARSNPASVPPSLGPATPAPSVLKSTPDPAAPTAAVPASTVAPTAALPTNVTTPATGSVNGAYRVDPTYGPSQLNSGAALPADRVTNAITRRFNPRDWYV